MINLGLVPRCKRVHPISEGNQPTIVTAKYSERTLVQVTTSLTVLVREITTGCSITSSGMAKS